MRRHKPAAVMHFAAHALVGESVSDPGKYYRNNVGGSLNLLRAMRRQDVNAIVFSSTCAVYGQPQRIPLTEDHPFDPISPYGSTKMMVERMLADFETAHGIRSVSLRYFNAAGADPDCRIGEDHDPETHLIPLILDVALVGRAEIRVFGEDYDTPICTCDRDYIHVNNVGGAHVPDHEHRASGGESSQFNLGNG